jgi:hypothetical protein
MSPTSDAEGHAAWMLLLDRLKITERKVRTLDGRVRDLKGEVGDLLDEHVRDDETGHYLCHDDSAEAIDAGEAEDEDEDTGGSDSETNGDTDSDDAGSSG